LHGLVSISSPIQGFPPFLGEIHLLYIVYIPPPQANEQEFQSESTSHFPSTLALGSIGSFPFDNTYIPGF